MEKSQEQEWLEAQKIPINADLVAAATRQLQFLAAIDRNRSLYEGPILERAIYRYQACWLPLLAKYGESLIMEGPLVVPLDCEWIWHCHRLNPVQYKSDCQTFYGRILDNQNVVSVVQDVSKKETENIWRKFYPDEPYELDLHGAVPVKYRKLSGEEEIKYDFVSAVKRQSSFVYQVSRPHMPDSRFLEEAVRRYKGFLHLIKRNKEKSIRRFCVPTYDIDLIWHSHQLQPVAYCKDLIDLHGKVLEHDDTDSDRSKGKKLDTGFSETTKQWEETFGLSYWRAGAMYRGSTPPPVRSMPWPLNYAKKSDCPCSTDGKGLRLTKAKILELCVEIISVRNLPVGHNGSLFVSVSKSHPDEFFNGKKKMTIFSETKEKQVFLFQCECAGELIFDLVSRSAANLTLSKAQQVIGTTSFSLENLFEQNFRYSVDRWFELTPKSDHVDSQPVSLCISMSFTPPTIAPFTFKMINSHPFSATACFFPLTRRAVHLRDWTCVVDNSGREIINLQMRNIEKAEGKKRHLVGIFDHSAEKRILAELSESEWSFVDSSWFLQIKRDSDKRRCIVDLRSDPSVRLFPGRKLDFEPKHCKNWKNESDFVTLVSFSVEYPYGKALAMLNLKNNFLMVNDESFVLRGIVLAYLLFDLVKREGNNRVAIKDYEIVDKGNEETAEKGSLSVCDMDLDPLKVQVCSKPCAGTCDSVSGGGCGGCGGGCGNTLNGGGCGGCGAGCGGCGGGCGNAVKSGGCGGGCGECVGGLGAKAKSGKSSAHSTH